MSGYKFFQNKECEFFPCHTSVTVNCLFCFCPLYPLKECGGTYTYTERGIKDCSGCTLPHEDYDFVIRKLKENNAKGAQQA